MGGPCGARALDERTSRLDFKLRHDRIVTVLRAAVSFAWERLVRDPKDVKELEANLKSQPNEWEIRRSKDSSMRWARGWKDLDWE